MNPTKAKSGNITAFKNFKNIKKHFYAGLPQIAFDHNGQDICWFWLGSLQPNGYGRITNGKHNRLLAHRVSYMIFNGNIPEGLLIRHTCDTPSCVNPRHLVIGTQTDNLHDMVVRSRHGMAKLTSEDVKNIKWNLENKKSPKLVGKLANKYNVSIYAIYDIKRKKSWAWLTS